VLDVGCGSGQTTRDAARGASTGSALGIDLSSEMLSVARQRAAAEKLTNIAFLQADAQIHPFEPESFDIAIGRSSAMFFGDLVTAFTNIAHALRPGGRLVLTTWQPISENEWIREISGALAAGRSLPGPPPNARGPFALSDPARVREILETAGFRDVDLEPVTAGMWFGDDANDAHDFILGLMGWMLEGLDDATRGRALAGLRSTVTAHETPQGVMYASGVWVIRATRR